MPGGNSLSLASPRESKQREGDPKSGSLRFATGNLRCSITAAVRTTRLRLKQVRPDPPPPSALLGPATRVSREREPRQQGNAEACPCGLRYLSWVFLHSPLVNAPRSAGSGGSGLALSEPKASLARPRLDRAPQVARSAAEGRRHQGRLFLGYFLLAKQKKVTGCRATPASTLIKQHDDQSQEGFDKLSPNGQGRSA